MGQQNHQLLPKNNVAPPNHTAEVHRKLAPSCQSSSSAFMLPAAAGPGFALTIAVTGDVQVSGAFFSVINTNRSSVEVGNQNLHQFCGLYPQFGFSYIFTANRLHTRCDR